MPFDAGNLTPTATSVATSGGSGANADSVDGYHAYQEPTAFSILPLDIDALLPIAAIPPLTAQFVMLATSAEATNERVLTAGDGLDLTDAGAGLAVTLAVDVTDLLGTGLSEDANNNLILPTPGSLSVSTTNAAAAPHTHEVLASSTPGAASYLLKTDSGGSLTLDGGVLRVDAVNNRVGVNKAVPTAPLDVVGNLQLDGDLILVGPQSVYTDSGNLTLKSASDLYLEAIGSNVRVKSAATIRSDAWTSGMGGTGWAMTYAGALDCRNIYAEELTVDSFTALVSQAHNGSLILTKAVAEVSRDFVVPAVGATATLYLWDLPGWADTQIFTSSDYVLLRYVNRSGGGLVVGDAWGQVTAYSNLSTGEQSYTFTTRSTPVSGQTVFAGTQALDYGVANDGVWQATVIHQYAPFTRIQTWSGANPYSGTFTTWAQEGNLEGLSTGWGKGFFAGQNTTNKYLRASSTAFELHGIAAGWYDASGNRRVWIDPTASGSLQSLFSAGPNSGDKRFDLRADGKLYLKDSIIIGDGSAFAISRAVLHCPLNGPQPYANEYHVHTVGSEGQPGTAVNVIGRPGRFAKSAQIAEATTNKVRNPIAGGGSGFATYGGGAVTRSASYYLLGDPAASTHYSFRVVTAASGQGASFNLDTLSNAVHYATVRVKGTLPAAWQWSLDASTWVTPLMLGTEHGWNVYGYQFTAAQANAKTAWYVKQNGAGAGTFYLDGLQIEAKAYATPIAHGAMPGHAWGGTAHNSGSTRTAATLTFANIPILAQGSIALWVQSSALMSKHTGLRVLLDGGGTAGVRLAITTTSSLALYVGSATAQASAALTDSNFPSFTFAHVAATWDAIANTSRLYLDGVLVGSGTCASLPADDAGGWDVGQVGGASYWPGLVDDLLITDYALSEEEVAILAGAGGPSTFVTDFSLLLTKAGGGQVIGNSSGLFGYDAAATPVWALITNEGETWGGESFSAGDVVLGNPAAANMLWDASAGQLKFRGGTTVQAYLHTDGSLKAGAGAVTLDANGIAIAIGSGSANRITWKSGSTYAAGIDSSAVGSLILATTGATSGNIQLNVFDAAGGPSGLDIVEDSASSKVDVWVNSDIRATFASSVATLNTSLVINRGAALTEPTVDLRADNVTHGLTSLAASTNTFGELSRASATSGGVRLRGFRESSGGTANYDALELHAWLGENATTAHTSAARGIIDLYAGQISGGAAANVVADGNVLTVRCMRGGASAVLFIVDEDGDIFYDGSAASFDDENDALMAMDAAHVLAGEYAKVLEYGQDELVRMGVIHTSGDGRLFVSQKRLTALTLGALGQLYTRLDRMERRLLLSG